MENEQTPKRKGLPVWLWIIIGIIVLAIIGNISNRNTPSTPTTESSPPSSQQTSTPAPTTPPIHISDEELTNEYVNNQFSADEKYKDRVLDVSGTVAAVDRDILGNPYVSLSNSQFIEDTVFHFTNSATDTASLASISVGELITIQGTCKGKTGTEVDMEDCSIIQNKQESTQTYTAPEAQVPVQTFPPAAQTQQTSVVNQAPSSNSTVVPSLLDNTGQGQSQSNPPPAQQTIQQTPTPTINTPVYASAIEITGGTVPGASIILSINGTVKATVTATNGEWDVTSLANGNYNDTGLAIGDHIFVTATAPGDTTSQAVMATVVAPPPGSTWYSHNR